ncbi:MAG: CRISPR-associated endonuclease Cas2 [Alphaproteobacteria bacterium]
MTLKKAQSARQKQLRARVPSYASGYELMWIWVLFDLPVVTKEERKQATKFRNYLLDEGFGMAQFSVYMRLVGSKERAEAVFDRVERNLPQRGSINMISITDRQYETIRTFDNRVPKKRRNPDQLKLL